MLHRTPCLFSLPPAATVPELREEMPEWAIPTYAPPGLHPQEREVRMVKVQVSSVLRTDVSALQMMVRVSLLPQGLRQRLAEILLVPEDRLKLFNAGGELLQEDMGIPDEVYVHDMWERHSAVYDILDVVSGETDQVRFMIQIDQTWTQEHLLSHPARILSKHPTQLALTDMNDRPWLYPEYRLQTSTIKVKIAPLYVDQYDLLGSMVDQRGGARTVSPTQPFVGDEGQSQRDQRTRASTEGLEPEAGLESEELRRQAD